MEIIYSAKINLETKNEFKLSNIPFEKIKDVTIYSISKNEMEFLFVTEYTDEAKALFDTSLMMKHFEKVFLLKEFKELKDIRIKNIRNEVGNNVNYSVNDKLTLIEVVKKDVIVDDFEGYREFFDDYGVYDKEYLDLYLSISKLKDLSGQYVMYYSIVSAILGSQRLIDEHIRNEIPNIEEKTTSRENANYDETIITYIRNQIGHTAENTDINQLYYGIEANLPILNRIVFNLIMNSN